MTGAAIILSDPFEAFVDDKVRSGDFQDRTAVVERGLSMLRDDDAKLQRLRDAIDEGLDELEAGLGIEVTDVRAWLDGLGR